MCDNVRYSLGRWECRSHRCHLPSKRIVFVRTPCAALVVFELPCEIPGILTRKLWRVHCNEPFALLSVAGGANGVLRSTDGRITVSLCRQVGKRRLACQPGIEVILFVDDDSSSHGEMADATELLT
jgi:hypothetical protein